MQVNFAANKNKSPSINVHDMIFKKFMEVCIIKKKTHMEFKIFFCTKVNVSFNHIFP